MDVTEINYKFISHQRSNNKMSNTPIYFLGFIVLIAGLAWGAFTLGVPSTWIAIGCVILTGIGIMSAVNYRGGGAVVTTSTPGGVVRERTVIES